MKVCYFIQSHKNPEQIYRLVRTIKKSSPTALVLIGHDATSCDLDMAPLQNWSKVYLLKSNVAIRWAHFSVLEPYLNAVNWLFEHDSDFEWLIYLSGQHYPTQPIAEIENFLSKSDCDGFIEYSDARQCSKEVGYGRYFYQYYHLPLPKRIYSMLKTRIPAGIIFRINKFQSTVYICFSDPISELQIGVRSHLHPFAGEFLCYRGSQWHSLSRKCVTYIKDFVDRNRGFVDYYRKTLVPDESFIQTILANSKLFHLCNDNKLYAEFVDSPNPKILKAADYPKITSGDFHFARKFDLKQDAEIVDMLDVMLL